MTVFGRVERRDFIVGTSVEFNSYRNSRQQNENHVRPQAGDAVVEDPRAGQISGGLLYPW